MNVRDFWRKYTANNLEAIYHFSGDDEGLRDFCIGRLRALVSELTGGKSQESSYNGKRELDSALDAASTASFFTTKQLIVIRGLEDALKKDVGRLENYLGNPSEFTILAFSLGKLKGNSALGTLLAKRGVKVECNKLSEEDRRNRVRKRLSDEGLNIAPDALALLVARSGDSILDIDQSVEKIVLRSEVGDFVEEALVRDLIDDVREDTVFTLIGHIVDSRISDGVLLWRKMLQRGESPTGLLYLLSRHLRILLSVQSLSGEKIAPKDLAARVGVAPFFLTNYRRQADRLSYEQLQYALERIRRIDYQGKQGMLKDGPALEMNLGVLFTRPAGFHDKS